MKIISKYKDYYDYLTGIYGIDEKLILDRTEFHITQYRKDNTMITFYICGYRIDGLYRGGKFYYGDDLSQFEERKKSRWFKWVTDSKSFYSIQTSNSFKGEYSSLLKEPTFDREGLNDKLGCPILIIDVFGKHQVKDIKVSKFPILKDYGFQSVLAPDKLYQMLYDFLSKAKDIPDTQTDKQKIIGKGFDYKHSFRNTK